MFSGCTLTLVASFAAVAHGATVSVTWAIPVSPQTLTVQQGDTVSFTWSGSHNVYQSASQSDFNGCVRTGGTLLATTSVNYYSTVMSSAGTFYYICEVPTLSHLSLRHLLPVLPLASTNAAHHCCNRSAGGCRSVRHVPTH